jgi:hypothetical protein
MSKRKKIPAPPGKKGQVIQQSGWKIKITGNRTISCKKLELRKKQKRSKNTRASVFLQKLTKS